MVALSALIIEQDPSVRSIVREVLQDRGYSVRAVASRAEGNDLIDELAPDLLFLDDPSPKQRVRRIVRLDRTGADVEIADVRADNVRRWLEGVLGAA
jgi:CheY-like chemotaxis protein